MASRTSNPTRPRFSRRITEAEYRKKINDPNYRFTAQRWRDHLDAFPDLDETSRRNVAQLIAYYDEVEVDERR